MDLSDFPELVNIIVDKTNFQALKRHISRALEDSRIRHKLPDSYVQDATTALGVIHMGFPVSNRLMYMLIATNRNEAFETLVNNGWQPPVHMCAYAAEMGYLACVQFLVGNGHYHNMVMLFESAVRSFQPEIMQFLDAVGCDWNPVTCVHLAAQYGRMDSIMWMYERRPDQCKEARIIEEAVKQGNSEMLEWACVNNFFMDEMATARAAEAEDLPALKLLRAYNCPWDSRVIEWSASEEVRDYARANGVPEM